MSPHQPSLDSGHRGEVDANGTNRDQGRLVVAGEPASSSLSTDTATPALVTSPAHPGLKC